MAQVLRGRKAANAIVAVGAEVVGTGDLGQVGSLASTQNHGHD